MPASTRQEMIVLIIKWTSVSVVILTLVVGAVYEFALMKAQVLANTAAIAKLPPDWLQRDIEEIKRELREHRSHDK